MRAPQPGDRLIWASWWWTQKRMWVTVGILTAGGRVVDAPPAARWMIGRDERHIADWLHDRGADLVACDPA